VIGSAMDLADDLSVAQQDAGRASALVNDRPSSCRI
jgi:hypothetical protein